jgi:hypothetical protein
MCYRRDDTGGAAEWLYDRLVARFGRDQIFRVFRPVEPGDDLSETIADAVGPRDVLLVLIGNRWLRITDEDGRRRLEKPDDFVRLEIEAAVQRHVQIEVILFDGATQPRADELPTSLARLTQVFPIELNPNTFESDTRFLLSRLDFDVARPGRADVQAKEEPVAPAQQEPVAQAKREPDAPGPSGSLISRLSGRLMPPRAKRDPDAQASQPRESRIFVSYRRDDSRWLAGRLFDRLRTEYGGNQIFRDVDTAKPGVRYDKRIRSALDECDVLIVVIGDTWLSATDVKGQRRLDSPNDLVRFEVSVALERGIPIIPVLVERTPMPTQEDLPDSINDLAFYDACRIEDERWDNDIQLLITSINELTSSESHGSNTRDRDNT